MNTQPQPASFSVQADRRLVRADAPDRRHVLVSLTAPVIAGEDETPVRPGVNVCFVLDRSGSMAGSKLSLARYAVERALAGLAPQDRFAIVTYDNQIDVVAPSALATDAAKQQALIGLRTVDARGSTALHAGWTRGADVIKQHVDPSSVNRVLLLTDGLANVGEKNPQTLSAFAADLRASGVATTTFGVGADFDESLLQGIADAGGGHFYFIERPEQIPDYMTGELGELLETAARAVVVKVRHAPGLFVQAISPVGTGGAAPGELDLLVGDLVAGQELELVLSIDFPPAGVAAAQTTVFFTVADRDAELKVDGCTIDFESADAAACSAEVPNVDVERAVARLAAAQARQQAVRFNRAGDFYAAGQVMSATRASVARFDDPEMQSLGFQLRVEEASLLAPMRELDRKGIHYRGSNLERSRDFQGKARREFSQPPEPAAPASSGTPWTPGKKPKR